MRLLTALPIAGLAIIQTVAPANGVRRIEGTDAGSGIAYVLISTDGKLVGASAVSSPAPRLTAVCTRTPAGKLKFELMADFGGVAEIAYYPPWKPLSSADAPLHQDQQSRRRTYSRMVEMPPCNAGSGVLCGDEDLLRVLDDLRGFAILCCLRAAARANPG